MNAALIAVMISADVNAYQTSRAGIARHPFQAPLGWHFVARHPARQVTAGVLVVVLFVLALVWLASRSWRYEAVRPPYQVEDGQQAKAREAAADTLAGGLADQEFWDGQGSVRLITWLHVAVAGGFLAITLGVTVRALAGRITARQRPGMGGDSPRRGHDRPRGRLRLPGRPRHAVHGLSRRQAAFGTLARKLRGLVVYLLVPAGAGLICSGWFAWLQPGVPSVRAADLPGMAGVTGWTALAITVAVAVALVSMLLGLRDSRGTLAGGSWVTLMLGFGSLNILLLGAEIWVAHLVGPVTSDAAQALSARPGQIYLPYVITSGVPLLVWAVVLAVLAVGAVEAVRWLRTARLPEDTARQYRERAEEFRDAETGPLDVWYWSGLSPFPPPGDEVKDPGAGRTWEQQLARVQFLARAPHDAGWLLWAVILAQLTMAVCVWQLHVQPPVLVRNIGIALAGLVLPALMAFLYAAWGARPSGARSGSCGTWAPSGRGPTTRCRPRATPSGPYLTCSAGCGGCTITAAGSSWSRTARARCSAPQRSCSPAAVPPDDQPALITFGSPLVKLYGWAFPAYSDSALPGRWPRAEPAR